MGFIQKAKQEEELSNLFSSVLMKNIGKSDSFHIAACGENKINKILIVTFIGGIASGMLGIGGGIVIAPLLLELGVDPKVATSTSNFLLIFSSATGTILFLLSVLIY